MAKKQNPYQQWLGLHPKLTNPNLFQLLGVDPRSQDEAAIKQKAVASAKMLLQRIKAVQPRNAAETEFKKKLHAKIVLAHQTMITPEKRNQYRKALISKAAAAKSGVMEVAPPNTTAADQAKNQGSLPAVQPPPANPNVNAAPVNAAPPEIPTALPMAMPVTSSPAATNATENAPVFSTNDAPVGQPGPNFDNLDAQPQVKVYAKKRKTSRSWVVPIVILTLLVGGVAGLVSMMTKYSNIFELIPALKEKVNVVASDPASTEDGGSKITPLAVPKTPDKAIKYNGDEEPDMEIPEGGMPLLIEDEGSGNMAKPDEKPEMKARANKRNNSIFTDDGDPKQIDEDESAGKKRILVDSKLSSIRMGLQRSRDSLFRQHLDLAKHFNSDVKDLLKRYKIANTKTITPKHRGLIRAVKTNEQIIGWVEDFWDQVRSSSIEMAGGDTIKIGDKTMALVEATEKDIVLRVAGQNERILYSNLTPILATTLGEMGSKESVPRWNLGQAAYLGVMAEQYDDAKQLQYRILNQMKIDGFDIESQAISDFTEPDWLELGCPKKKLKPFSDDQFNKIIAKERKQLGYEDPSSVSDDRVDELIYKLTLNLRKDQAIRVARLWEAVAMIKKGRRTWDLMYVNRELNNCCTEVDFNRSFVGPMLHIIKNEKDPARRDLAARQTIIFVKQFDGNPSFTPRMRKKLLQTVKKIAKDVKSNQLAAMAEQLLTSSN